jgi:hypothetical protein
MGMKLNDGVSRCSKNWKGMTVWSVNPEDIVGCMQDGAIYVCFAFVDSYSVAPKDDKTLSWLVMEQEHSAGPSYLAIWYFEDHASIWLLMIVLPMRPKGRMLNGSICGFVLTCLSRTVKVIRPRQGRRGRACSPCCLSMERSRLVPAMWH